MVQSLPKERLKGVMFCVQPGYSVSLSDDMLTDDKSDHLIRISEDDGTLAFIRNCVLCLCPTPLNYSSHHVSF